MNAAASSLERLGGFARDLFINGFAVGAGVATLRDELTAWLALISVILGIIGAIYTIANQRRLRRAGHRPDQSVRRAQFRPPPAPSLTGGTGGHLTNRDGEGETKDDP